jgi:hypothetical protein
MINKEITTTYTPILTINQVRLIDVFVIAPFLIYAGTRKELNKNVRTTLIVLGVATLLFNANNYLKNKQ